MSSSFPESVKFVVEHSLTSVSQLAPNTVRLFSLHLHTVLQLLFGLYFISSAISLLTDAWKSLDWYFLAGDSFAPQETFSNIWGHFWLSPWGNVTGIYWVESRHPVNILVNRRAPYNKWLIVWPQMSFSCIPIQFYLWEKTGVGFPGLPLD